MENSSVKSQTKITVNQKEQVSLSSQLKDADELVVKILTYRNKANGRLYDNMNQDFLLNLLEKSKIIEIEKSFPQKGLDIIDFVRLFLNNIPHKEDETLFLTISLIELFKRISESLNLSTTIKMKHITSVICDRMQEKNSAQYKIQTVLMPEPQKFKLEDSKIRQIDIDPPPIYGRYDDDLQRLVKQKIKTDSMHHLNHRIKTGVYAKDIKRIISLDSLSDRINMYSIDCEFKQNIRPKSNTPTEKVSSDVIIFSFAWSERQERLGATLKDFSLSFWDRSDNFKYEKQISIQSFMSDYQTNIWYLEFPNCWITTDAKNQLYEWDLERECVKRTLSSPKIKHTIFEVVEIPELKLVAVGSSDRLVTIWNFNKGSMVQCIEFLKAGIHSLVYFKSYQVLVCGGFQNNISLHQLDPKYLDVSNKGLLIGHQSMITAIDCVEKTPMIISSDDSGTLKIWDIRTLKCIQTVDCGQRTVITKIINIYPKGKLCFLGTRINVIDFDEADMIVKKSNQKDDAFPIKIENTPNQMIVVTRKDIRFIDIDTGKIKQIFVGLLSDAEDEITAFKQIEQGSKFILGNHRGEISLHNFQNGELINKLHSHLNEVTSIRIDYLNKLLISGGWDSNIKIQHLTDSGSEIKREIINCFNNKEVTIIEVSVYHNLLFAASNSEFIYVFDYEFAKLLYCIELETKVEVQAMSVVNGFSLLFISANNGYIYIMNFTKKEYQFNAKLIGYIDIPQLINYHQSNEKEDMIPVGTIIPQSTLYDFNTQESLPLNISQLALQSQTTKNLYTSLPIRNQKTTFDYSHTNTPISIQSNAQYQTHLQTVFANSAHKVIAANRFLIPQISQIQFSSGAQNQERNPQSSQRSGQQDEVIPNQTSQQQEQTAGEEQKEDSKSQEENKKVLFVNKILLDTQVSEPIPDPSESSKADKLQNLEARNLSSANSNRPSTNKLTKLQLYCSLNKGDIIGINLLPFYEQFENIFYTEHCNSRINYNAFRGNTENFLKIKNEKISMHGMLIVNGEGRKCTERVLNQIIYKNIKFYKQCAHKDILTSLKMINLKEQYLLTSSMDCFIKVWNKDTGDLKASLNINHPLPLIWNIEKDIIQEGKKKIIFALKILDVIYRKYTRELSFSEQRKVKVTDFLAQIMQSSIETEAFSSKSMEKRQEIQDQLKKIPITEWIARLIDPKDYKGEVLLMKDQFSPRDLKYEKSKQFFQSELTGPSLKRMEANKRVAMATKAWKQENESKEAELENQLRNENHLLKNYKYEEREEIVAFLEQNYRDKLIGNEFTKLSEEFSKGTQDFLRKLDLHLIQKRHHQIIQAQMNQSTQNENIKKRNTRIMNSSANQSSSQTNLQDDALEATAPNILSKRRQEGSFSLPKNYMNEQKDNKNKKVSKKKKKNPKFQDILLEQPADFYDYAKEKQLMFGSALDLKLHTHHIYHNHRQQHPPQTNEIQNQQDLQKKYSQSVLLSKEVAPDQNLQQSNISINNSMINQSSIFPIPATANINQSQGEISNVHEDKEHTQISQVNMQMIQNKNNSTTIGPNSTVLNTSQDEIIPANIKQMLLKEGSRSNKMNKLSLVLKSMDQKIKKAQQNFNDDSIISHFLQKRKDLSINIPSNNDASMISQQIQERDQKQEKMSMNESSILPIIKITDQSAIHGNTSQIMTENNSMMLKDLSKDFTTPNHSKPYKIGLHKQHQKSSKILTQNGLNVLKKALYDIPSERKIMFQQNHHPYIPSAINSSKSIRSAVNKSTPHLFSYHINQSTIQYPHNNAASHFPIMRQNTGGEPEALLNQISEQINSKTQVAQKLVQYKNTLNSNIQNAYSLYQRIEDSLANSTPMNLNQLKQQK